MKISFFTTDVYVFVSKNLFKTHLFVFFSLCFSIFGFGQNERNIKHLWQSEPFGKNDLASELIDKRDAFSKHFQLANGSIQAHIASGPIHYLENGQWKTIFHTISPSTNGFENIHNSHKTFYPATSDGSIKTVLENGAVIKDMLGMRMYFEVNGQIVQPQNIQSKNGVANFNELTYAGVYGNGIDLRLTQNSTNRKMDYIIHSLSALGTIPAGATSLIFEETVELPNGWTAELRDNLIYLLDASGKIQAKYEKPVFKDAPFGNTEDATEKNNRSNRSTLGNYTLSQISNVLKIQTQVSISWITASERIFPITIDPTVNVVPDNTVNWSRSVVSDGWNYSNLIFGTDGYGLTNGSIKFNLSAIPAAATINSANVYWYLSEGYGSAGARTYQWRNSNDPTLGGGLGLFTSMTTAFTANTAVGAWVVGWRAAVPFNATGLAQLQSNFGGALSCGIVATGTWNTTQTIVVADYSTGALRPYITIDYTACTPPAAPRALANVLLGPIPQVNGATILPDANFSANSCWTGCVGGNHEVWRGRLFNSSAGTQCWASGTNALDGSEYVQYDLGSVKPVNGIATQTRGDCCGQRVTAYTVRHSYDGITWTTIPGTFTGNLDDVNVVTNMFATPVSARYVRIYPTGFVNHMSMRAEVISIPCGGTNVVHLSAEITPNANTVRWYDAASGGTLLHTGQFFSPSISASTTYYAEAYNSTTLCASATRTAVTAVVNPAPTLDGITVSSNCWFTDNVNTYTITTRATGCFPTAFDNSQYGMLALINFQGANSPNYGGYFAWNASAEALTAAGFTLYQMPCTGGGFVAMLPGSYGHDKSTLVSASTSMTGNQRTVNFVVRPNTNFPIATNNSISQFVSNTNGTNIGWTEVPNLFSSTPPFTMGLLTVNGNTNTSDFVDVCPGQTILVQQSGFNDQSGSTYFYSDDTDMFGGWTVAPVWQIMDFGNITPANQVNGQTAVNDLASFAYKINTPGLYVLHANSYYGSCYGNGSNRWIRVQESTAPTTISPPTTTLCHGSSITLTASGGVTSQSDVHVWQPGACNIAYEQNWNTNPFGSGSTTVNSVNGILNLTSTTNDPMIFMDGLGSFDPNVYRYINIRYRVLAGTAGNTEIFFYNTAHNFAVGGETGFGALISDGAWHVLTIDMHADPQYVTGGNILGWRYDWSTAAGVTMELDFISLDQHPIIQTGTSLTVTPTQTTTYSVSKRTNCGTTSCATRTLTMPTAGNTLNTSTASATCNVSGSQWIRFYDGSGNFLASVNPNSNLSSNITVTSYVGSPSTMDACDAPGNTLYRTAYMGRNWVITSDATPTGGVTIGLPFYQTELAALATATTTLTPDNDGDNVTAAGEASLMVTKFSATIPANENSTPTDNCGLGTILGVAQIGSGDLNIPPFNIPNAKYVAANIASFSEFYLHGNNIFSPLPVTLIDFKASCVSTEVTLNWSTASEFNADRFIIERSRQMNQWTAIGELQAAGNSNQTINYTFTDTDPISGISYYRLRQVDFDGKEEFFGPISVDCENSSNTVKVYPNPTAHAFTVEINSLEDAKNTTVQLTDVMGKVISSKSIDLTAGTNLVYFQETFESGTYLIRVLTATNEFETVKVVVKH